MGATTTFLLLYCAALATLPRTLPAQTGFAEIYAFGHQPDAHAPGGLVLGPDGALYGVGASGGTYGYGAVFRLQPPSSSGGAWTETVLHSFTGQNGDGIVGGYLTTPVFGPNGALYGTNSGTVFELRPPATPGGRWIENILYSFPGPGVYPRSMLVGSGGTLYGTAFSGGAYGEGMVFAVSPPRLAGGPWTEHALYNFTGTVDGALPQSLIAGPNGVLYGTTALGGAFNNGVLFQLSPNPEPRDAWIQTVLFNFSIGIQNFSDSATVSLYSDGAIYGTALLSTGSALIQLQPGTSGPWTQTVLYTFPQNGTLLSSPLILRHGNLFGTTATITGFGGQGRGGDVFELQKPAASGDPWNEGILHHFQKLDSPHGNVVFDTNGVIYGTTNTSNAAPHGGYAYQLILPAAN